MIASSRGLVRQASRAQWRSFASAAGRPPRSAKSAVKTGGPRAKPTPPPPKISRPYQPKPSSPSPPPPPPPADTLASLWSSTWLPLTGAALLAGALGFYIVGTFAASVKSSPCPCGEHSTPTGRPPALTGDNAEQFDKELDVPEWWMGITKLRRRLAAAARGDVLELAVGSGRNLAHYDWAALSDAVADQASPATNLVRQKQLRASVASFTGLDISVDMLDVARRRLVKTVPPMADAAPVVSAASMTDHTGGQLSFLGGRLRLIHSDAHRALPPSPAPGGKYDTVVQTFGLCSVADPVAVLANLATAVKPGTGRIVLLEHGKGWYGVVNGLLDRNAGKHFDKYGCWWNRDIQNIVEEAARQTPGLEVVKIERPNVLQMGTLVWVELRVAEAAETAKH